MSYAGRIQFTLFAFLSLARPPDLLAHPSCIDYSQSSRWIGDIAVSGSARDVAVNGSLVIIATVSRGLAIADISHLESPRIVGSLAMPGSAKRLAVNGALVYAAIDSMGLSGAIAVVDISNPVSPRMIEYVHLGNYVHDLSLSGTHLYAACGDLGLVICDVSNSSHLQIQGRLPTLAFGVTATDNRIYVAGRSLSIVDASDSWNPTLIGSVGTSESWAVAVRGQHAYLPNYKGGLQIVDVADPAAPFVCGYCAVPGTALDVALVGHCAYVAGCGMKPLVVDIEVPSAPRAIGTLALPENSLGLHSVGCLLCIASGEDRVEMFNIAFPPKTSVVGGLQPRSFGASSGIATLNGLAAVTDDASGFLDVIDVHDPSSPMLLGSCWLPRSGCAGYADGIVLAGALAYVTNGKAGLKVIDLSSPASPRIIGSVTTPDTPMDVELRGSLAVVADLYFGIVLVDVSTPASPVVVGSQELSGSCHSVALDGNYAYLAADEAGGHIVDISDPVHPRLVSDIETPGITNHILVSKPYAYVTSSPGTLTVVNIADPLSPQVVGTIAYPHLAGDLEIADGFLYVCDGWGIEVFDISEPGRPWLRGGIATPGHSAALNVTDNCVLVADWDLGLTILPRHCSDLVSPEVTELKVAAAQPHGVRLTWRPTADLSDMQVERSLHLTRDYGRIGPERLMPELCEFVDETVDGYKTFYYRLKCITRTGECKYFGPVSARMINELTPVLDPVSPNPVVNAPASISFTLNEDGNARVRILDISGRQVRVLGDGPFSRGAHVLAWDGRDDRGGLAPSGIYFCELRRPGVARTQRFVRLR